MNKQELDDIRQSGEIFMKQEMAVRECEECYAVKAVGQDIPALVAEIERMSNNAHDIKGKIVEMVKDAYQQGYRDGQVGEPAFEDGIESDVWAALSDIFGELGVDES